MKGGWFLGTGCLPMVQILVVLPNVILEHQILNKELKYFVLSLNRVLFFKTVGLVHL